MKRLIGVLTFVMICLVLFWQANRSGWLNSKVAQDRHVDASSSYSTSATASQLATDSDRNAVSQQAASGDTAADKPTSAAIEVHVQTLDGKAIGGASVVTFNGHTTRKWGDTDQLGNLALNLTTEIFPVSITLCALGFATVQINLADPDSKRIVVRMAPERRIHGRVMTTAGSVPSGVITVLASSSGPPRDVRAWIQRLFDGDVSVVRATADAGGEFELVGLPGSDDCLLYAGGDGWLAEDAIRKAASDTEPANIIVKRVLGVTFVLRDSITKQPLEMSRDEWNASRIILRSKDRKARTLPSSESVAAYLAGAPLGARRTESNRIVHFVTCADNVDSAGPLILHVALPGAEALEVQGMARPIEQGVPEVDVFVDHNVGRLGSIRLIFGGRGDVPAPAAHFAVTPLHLRLENETERGLDYPLQQPSGDDYVVSGIPEGNYSAWVVAHNGAFSFPLGDDATAPVAVRAGSVSDFLVDLSSTGALEFRIANPNEQQYSGALQFVLERSGATPLTTAIGIREHPYYVSCISAGEYTIRILQPSTDAREPDKASLHVIVRPGATSFVDLRTTD